MATSKRNTNTLKENLKFTQRKLKLKKSLNCEIKAGTCTDVNLLEDHDANDNTAIPETNEETFDEGTASDNSDENNAANGNEGLLNGHGSDADSNDIKGRLSDKQNDNHLRVEDLAALGPAGERVESPRLARKKHGLVIDETKASAGFQDLKNAGRFWKASQIMGTRKGP